MIDPTTIEVLEECSRRSVAENITFPEVVQRLASAGVEFYYTDLYQHRKTYYFPNGDARTIQDDLPNQPAPAIDFSADEVSSAIKKIQRGEISIPGIPAAHPGCGECDIHGLHRRKARSIRRTQRRLLHRVVSGHAIALP